MIPIKAPSIGKAHELIVDKIFKSGFPLPTEDDEATIELRESSCIYVDNPLADPMWSPRSRFQKKFLDQYAHDVLYGGKASFEYDYHGRICDYKVRVIDENGREIDSEKTKGINQFDYMIRKLNEEPYSRRAVAITWQPWVDENKDDNPCLQLLQYRIRPDNSGVLRLYSDCVFRSNDMLTASGANMYAFARFQEWAAKILDLPPGPYEHISLVPHIYYLRDRPDLEKMQIYEGGWSQKEFERRFNQIENEMKEIKSKCDERKLRNSLKRG